MIVLLETDLSACPHDGQPAKVSVRADGRWEVKCTRCPLACHSPKREHAEEAWNDRASQVRKWLAQESATDNRFAYLKSRADVRRCCANPDNLEVASPKPDELVAICRKCNTKHTKLRCEPAAFAISGSAATFR